MILQLELVQACTKRCASLEELVRLIRTQPPVTGCTAGQATSGSFLNLDTSRSLISTVLSADSPGAELLLHVKVADGEPGAEL